MRLFNLMSLPFTINQVFKSGYFLKWPYANSIASLPLYKVAFPRLKSDSERLSL